MDTIFALSSGQPPAAIAVIRISGPRAGAVLGAMAGRMPIERRATLVTIRNPSSGEQLDASLVLWFPGPRTATGEDLAEIHCHGGRAVAAAIMKALEGQPGCRLAEPGEFTRRAFENGRIDLNEAEGLADLLFAETETQRRAALTMAQGAFSRKIADWQSALLKSSADVEAALDFSDEDDVPAQGIEQRIREGIKALADEIALELLKPSAERLRDGIKVVIAGPPNAGKSTLLNALVGRDAAIVSSTAGTTRDRIEVPIAFEGIPFLITDTAGLREATEDIEAVGIRRANDAIADADILLWLGEPKEAPREDALLLASKSDMPDWVMPPEAHLAISAISHKGIEDLIKTLRDRGADLLPRTGEYALHDRQRRALAAIVAALTEALCNDDMLVIAEMLRTSRVLFDRLTGRAGTEEMLDALFGSFCIGK